MKNPISFSNRIKTSIGLFSFAIASLTLYSCENECESVRVQFRNEYANQTIKLYIHNSQSATLVPGEIVARDVRPGNVKVRFESMAGTTLCHGDAYVNCDDDYFKQFRCPQ